MILPGFRLAALLCMGVVTIVIFTQGTAHGQAKPLKEEFFLTTYYSNRLLKSKFEKFHNPLQVENALRKELSLWVNNGYPFSTIHFDTIAQNSAHTFVATVDPGPVVVNGRIINRVDSASFSKLLGRWLRFKKEGYFSLDNFAKMPLRLKQMPFASLIADPWVEWFGNQAIVHVSLEKRKTNSFSGILGILPQPSGGTIVTGNVDASLKNLFGHGIGLDVKWNRFAPESQTANVKVLAPFINYSGLGAEVEFDLFRQDSLLNKQRFEGRLVLVPGCVWQYKLGYVSSSFSSTERLSTTENIALQSISLAAVYNPTPIQGVDLRRKFFRVQALPSFKEITTGEAKGNLPQLTASLQAVYPISFGTQRFATQARLDAGGVWSQEIRLADQNRLGGFQSVRGFNENFFFASQHILVGLQPQYLIDRTLLVHIFLDYLIFNAQRNMKGLATPETAVGAGIGAEFEVGTNLFQISLANGTTKTIPLDYQATKIHFGYVARF